MDISKLKTAYKWMTSDFRDFFTGEHQFHYGWNFTDNPIGFWATSESNASYFKVINEKVFPDKFSVCMKIQYNQRGVAGHEENGKIIHFTVNEFYMLNKPPIKKGLIPIFWTGNDNDSWSLDLKDFWRNREFFEEKE